MIFQISYKTNAYDDYLLAQKEFIKGSRIIFDTHMVNSFLEYYGYREKFEKLRIKPGCEYAKNAILMDAFRLMVLYELGGVYIDADVHFTPEIKNLESDLWKKFKDRNVLVRTKSLFFIKGIKNSALIEHLLRRYLNADELDYDVKMLGTWNLHEFKDEIAIIEPQFLNKYLIHDKVTTK